MADQIHDDSSRRDPTEPVGQLPQSVLDALLDPRQRVDRRLQAESARALDTASDQPGVDLGPARAPHREPAIEQRDTLCPSIERAAAGSITLTSRPSSRAEAANSLPIQPAPTTATPPPPSNRARRASQSASVRR